jgi:hypothetical protein
VIRPFLLDRADDLRRGDFGLQHRELVVQVGGHRRANPGGAYDRGVNAERPHLDAQAFHERVESRLAGAVGEHARQAAEGRDAGQGDEMPAPPLAHAGQHGRDAVGDAGQIDVDDLLDVVGPQVLGGCLDADPGAGDEELNGSETAFHVLDCCNDSIRPRDISPHTHARVLFAKLTNQDAHSFGLAIEGGDGVAALGEQDGDGFANATAGAGDQGDGLGHWPSPRCRLNITRPRGGNVTSIENGRPCQPMGAASAPPKLPSPLPPYSSASLLRISS